MQETLVRAWQRADRFAPARGSARAWVFAIAATSCSTAGGPMPPRLAPLQETPNARSIGYGFPLEPPPEDVPTGGCVVRNDGTAPTRECRGAERHRWRHSP